MEDARASCCRFLLPISLYPGQFETFRDSVRPLCTLASFNFVVLSPRCIPFRLLSFQPFRYPFPLYFVLSLRHTSTRSHSTRPVLCGCHLIGHVLDMPRQTPTGIRPRNPKTRVPWSPELDPPLPPSLRGRTTFRCSAEPIQIQLTMALSLQPDLFQSTMDRVNFDCLAFDTLLASFSWSSGTPARLS